MRETILRGAGQNDSERFLFLLAEQTFLNIWTYPNVYRNQKINGSDKGDGKELCDVLIVCGDDVIVFSDKDIGWCETANAEVAWGRWLREAVLSSANQLYGAMRWLKEGGLSSRLYLDKACTQAFPIELPPPERMRLHGIVVAAGANDASKRARPHFEGRLTIDSGCAGSKKRANFPAFTLGDIDPSKPFVHVFDRGGIAMLLTHLNTITDFANYLNLRERAIRTKQIGSACGEDDILGVYLQSTLDDGSHAFPFREGLKANILRGRLGVVLNDAGFKRKQIADQESYLWDELISQFGTYLIEGTAALEGDANTFHERQTVLRVMAQESRLSRRMFAQGILDGLETMAAQTEPRYARFFLPHETSDRQDNAYIFLMMAVPEFWHPNRDYEKYRDFRKLTLKAYCYALLQKHPELRTCIGIAVDAPPPFPVGGNSQDLAYINREIISRGFSEHFDRFCADHGVLRTYDTAASRSILSVDEYPQG